MLSHVTWQQYLAAIGLATLAYYLIVFWLYYRKDFIRLLNGKKPASFETFTATAPPDLMGAIQENTEAVQDTPASGSDEETISGSDLEFYPDDYPDDDNNQALISDTFDELEQLSMRLRQLMENSGKKANRTELTQKIQKELAAFSAKTNPENFKEAINRFIQQQSKELCNVQIEPADLKVIWS